MRLLHAPLLAAAFAIQAASLVVAATASPQALHVEATYPEEPTGTMHFAATVTLSIGTARPLRVPGSLPPIPGPTFPLSDGRFVLLGWSSPGAGMQSMHALLVGVRAGTVTLFDQLISFTDRPHAALLVRKEGGSVLIGVPEPPSTFLHDEEGWSLQYGLSRTHRLLIGSVRRLPFEPVGSGGEDVFYAPPTNATPRTARVAWFHVTRTGFAVASAAKSPRR